MVSVSLVQKTRLVFDLELEIDNFITVIALKTAIMECDLNNTLGKWTFIKLL